jgi:hypothetical protein
VIVSIPKQTTTFFITPLIVAAACFCYAGFMNGTQRRTILYGDSLILQGVRAELAGGPSLEVILWTISSPGRWKSYAASIHL